ncbi:MAG: hypothetical protein L3J71_12975 [Victivallaceae bacterium]|nr:hypothetical protein [Victivallaceae bacterium]
MNNDNLGTLGAIQLINGHNSKNIAMSDENISIIEQTTRNEKSVERQLRITNNSTEQLWLEVRFCIPLNAVSSDQNLLFWDGYSERKIVEHEHILGINADPVDCPQPLPDKLFPLSEGFKQKMLEESGDNGQVVINVMFSGPCKLNVLPLCAIYDCDSCLGIAIDPHQLYSYQSCGIKAGNIYKSVKLVIDPSTTEQVTFITFTCSGKYGFRAALASYYEIFDDCYSCRPGIDPRLNGSAETSSYTIEHDCAELLLEDRRRFGADWVWSMHAYATEGLLFPRRDDHDPYGTFVEDGVLGKSYDEFIEYIQQAYDNADESTAIAYYVLPQILNEAVMREHYPEAEWLNSKGETLPLIDFGAESHREHSIAVAVLPWGGAYGKRCAEDIQLIAEQIKPAAIAFDNVEGPRMDFAEHAQKCPGRAFTDGKVYVTQAIAYAKLMQTVRKQQTRHGVQLGVAGNHSGSYHTAVLTDCAIVEHGPWTDVDGALALRYDMGAKPIIYWGPKEFNHSADYQGEALEAKLTELNIWLFLFSLRTGILPNPAHNIKGYPFMQQQLPLLRQLAAAGWVPVPGATSDTDQISVQRYGTSYLTIVNENTESQTATVTIEKHYFSSELSQPVAIYGKMGQLSTEGNNWLLQLDIPPRQAVVLAFKAQPEECCYDRRLLDFKFIEGTEALSQIIISNPESSAEKFAAQRIVSYFKYYSLMQRFGNELPTRKPDNYQVYLLRDIQDRPVPDIPILNNEFEACLPNSIVIAQNSSSDAEKISITAGRLKINYSDNQDLDKNISGLLKYLDRKYIVSGRKWFEMHRAQNSQEALLMGALQ